jgi:DNA-binding SARP family transcriptional activator/tetratricopeptide (TPR) repeat protein
MGVNAMFRLRTFGDCVIEAGAHRIGTGAGVLFGTVLLLAVERGKALPRQVVRDLMWPDADEERARQCLRQIVYKVRRLGITLETSAGTLCLPARAVHADFAPLLDSDTPGGAAESLRGSFLPGYVPTHSQPFADWVERLRERMHGQLRRVVVRALNARRTEGDWEGAEAVARQCLLIDPLNEEATLALAEAMALGGSKVNAVTLLDRYLEEVGAIGRELHVPATLLRRRIAERPVGIVSQVPPEGRFVGRADGMALLNTAFERARAGTSASCYVWGEPGIGKSRLIEEFTRGAALLGVRVHRIGCLATDQQRPLSIFAELVPRLLAMPGALGCSPESLGYLRRLFSHDSTVSQLSPASADAEVLASHIRHSLFDLIDAVSTERCLVVVIEDVHWLDAVSWQVLGEIAAWAGGRQLCLIVTSRDEPAPVAGAPPRDWPGLVTHRVRPLDTDDALMLVRSLTVHRPARPDAVEEWCVRIAEGNPFYLRELVQHWLLTGDLQPAPPSLNTLIGRRLDRLPARALRVLQACAVLGRFASLDRLHAILEYKNYLLLESLDQLASGGLLVCDGEQVTCKHELIADAALRRLSDLGRRTVHRLAGTVLERDVASTQSAALLWSCAQHWQQAGEVDRGLRLAGSCANHLLELGLPNDAAELLERALAFCATSSQRIEMMELLGVALRVGGRWRRLTEVIPDTRRLREQASQWHAVHDEEELTLLEAEWRAFGQPAGLLEHSKECLAARDASADHRLRAASLGLIIADAMCSAADARDIYTKAGPLLASSDVDELARLQVELIYHTAYGDLDIATSVAERAIVLERKVGDPAALARALRFAAYPFRRCGLHDVAIRSLEEALHLAEKYRLGSAALPAINGIVSSLIETGDLIAANKWYARAMDWVGSAEDTAATLSIKVLGAQLALAGGRVAEAAAIYGEGLAEVNADPMMRRSSHTISVHLRIQLAQGKPRPTVSDIDTLQRLHTSAWAFGGQDYPAMALFSALTAVGQGPRALAILQQYATKHRRERWPLPTEMRLALTESMSAQDIVGSACVESIIGPATPILASGD